MFAELGGRIAELTVRLTALDRDLATLHKSNPVSQLLAEIPGVGPISALSFALTVDVSQFRSGRHLAASLIARPFVNSRLLLCCRTGVTVLSAVGRLRRNIWSEAQALQCPQRARYFLAQNPSLEVTRDRSEATQ
jgi:transposase